jgi:hypothetical protein
VADGLRDLLVSIGFDVEDKPLEGLNEKLEGIHKSVAFIELAEKINLAVEAFKLVGEAAHKVYEFIEGYAEFGEQLESAAIKAGLTTDALQKLQYAAAANGVSTDQLSTGLAFLSRSLYSAREGSEQSLKAFKAIGISREQTLGFANAGDAMLAVADRIKAINDPAKQNAVLMRLLGRGGFQMGKFMKQGADGIRELMGEAKDMGAVLGEDKVQALAKLKAQMTGIGMQFKVMGANIAAVLVPAVAEVLKWFSQLGKSFSALASTSWDEFTDGVAYAVGFAIGVFKGFGILLSRFYAQHKEFFDGFGSVFMLAVDEIRRAIQALFIVGGVALGGFIRGLGIIMDILTAVGDVAVTVFGWIIDKVEWLAGKFPMLKGLVEGIKQAPADLLGMLGPDVGTQLKKAYQLISRTDNPQQDAAVPPKDRVALIAQATGLSSRDVLGILNAQNAPAVVAASASNVGVNSPVMSDWEASNKTINIDAPVTVTIPDAADAKQTAQAVADQIADHQDRLLRQAKMALVPVVHY